MVTAQHPPESKFIKVVKFFSPLLLEPDVKGVMKLSKGSVAFWLVFGLAMSKWYLNANLPSGMVEILYALLFYSVFKVPMQGFVGLRSSQGWGGNTPYTPYNPNPYTPYVPTPTPSPTPKPTPSPTPKPDPAPVTPVVVNPDDNHEVDDGGDDSDIGEITNPVIINNNNAYDS